MIKTLEGLDLADRLVEAANRMKGRVESARENEEQTKTSLVLPFVNHVLGYNVFDPDEFRTEFTADVGTKRGEKVDYAIMAGDETPAVLIECKALGTNLDQTPKSQLYRYFGCTAARIGILTDGMIYRFFTDIDEPNKMDERPFFEVNMGTPDQVDTDELKRFTRGNFAVEEVTAAARDLKYTREIERLIGEEAARPSEGLVKHFAGQLYKGPKTQRVIDTFRKATKKAFADYLTRKIAGRLQAALNAPPANQNEEPAVSPPAGPATSRTPRRTTVTLRGTTKRFRNSKAAYVVVVEKMIETLGFETVSRTFEPFRTKTPEIAENREIVRSGDDTRRVHVLAGGQWLFTSLSRAAMIERMERLAGSAGLKWDDATGLKVEHEENNEAGACRSDDGKTADRADGTRVEPDAVTG